MTSPFLFFSLLGRGRGRGGFELIDFPSQTVPCKFSLDLPLFGLGPSSKCHGFNLWLSTNKIDVSQGTLDLGSSSKVTLSVPKFDGCTWHFGKVFYQVSLISRIRISYSEMSLCYFKTYKWSLLTYLLTYLQFSVIKWAKQHPGQSPIDVKSNKAI
jgi:hypothetical protein